MSVFQPCVKIEVEICILQITDLSVQDMFVCLFFFFFCD